MIEATLFRDMKAEGWRSMDRYADSLSRQLSQPKAGPPPFEGLRTPQGLERRAEILNYKFSIFSAEPPIKSSRVNLFWRNQVYPRLAKDHQGDINHVLDHSYAHLLKFLDPRKTVVTCHDLIPLEYEKDPVIIGKFRSLVSNLDKATFIIADSVSTKEDLSEKLAVSKEKIKVIYLGVDPIFRPLSADDKAKVVNKYSLPDGKLIMSHSNTLAYKNIEGMLKAFREVLLADDLSYFIRVGTEPLTQTQRRLVWELGISDNFYEIINPSDEELVGLYNCADVFLSPSLKEGFGLTVLQSLACGTPVVVSKGTSLEEIAGKVGVYVDPKSVEDITTAILSVFNRQPSTVKDKEALIRRASEFTWEKTARETLEVYESINNLTRLR
jgi:glycosyltransferase involved in cell wall biosynthesis